MVSGNKFRIRFDEFENKVKTFWQDLQTSAVLHDVTLSCEDGQIKAHRAVLASCSPVFRSILKLNPNLHPWIYFRKIKFENLQKVVSFMYQGEVGVAEEDLPIFLEVAIYLEITGLSEKSLGLEDAKQGSERLELELGKQEDESLRLDHAKQEGGSLGWELAKPKDESLKLEPAKPEDDILEKELSKLEGELLVLEQKYSKDIGPSPESISDAYNLNDSTFKSDPSSLLTKSQTDIAKIEINQYQSLVIAGENYFTCEKCNEQFKFKKYLYQHSILFHEKVHYSCENCDYKARNKPKLRRHVESVHQKFYVTCIKCNKRFSRQDILLKHNHEVHEGVRSYSCEFCDHKSARRTNLNKHILNVHKDKA